MRKGTFIAPLLSLLFSSTVFFSFAFAVDLTPPPGGQTHFYLWFDYNVLGRTIDSRGHFFIGGKVVKTLYIMEGKSRSTGSGAGAESGRYFGHKSDLVLELPDSTMTGEDVLAYLDDLIDPKGPLASTTEYVITHSARTPSGAALTVLYQTPNGSHRGMVSFTVSETHEQKAVLTTKEYDLQFLSLSGNAETLHLALFTDLSDRDNLNRLMTEKLRFRPAQKRSRSNAFAFTYQNRQYTLIGNAIISIRDTGPGTAILTLQLWESLIHPRE